MSLRIRSDGRVLCAAMHPAEPDDTYIDDTTHHKLASDLRVLVSEPMDSGGRGGHAVHGQWWWVDEVPDDVTPEVW